jgi:hypothetical protein
MALQTSGQITLQDIAYEFDDAAPHALTEFYGAASGVPTSGEITLADFYGASASFYNGVISGSARFNGSNTSYLYRSQTTTTNTRKFTLSAWVKPSQNGYQMPIISAATTINNWEGIGINAEGYLAWYSAINNNFNGVRLSNVHRDPASWYHVVMAFDSTLSTQADRVKFYVNGTQQTNTQGWHVFPGYAVQNRVPWLNNSSTHHWLGRFHDGGTNVPGDGYLAEVNFIDGQQLAASNFGEFKNGVWIAKEYTGTYGSNGFHMDFGTSLTADQSGNGNNFTAGNMGSTDLMLDSPENNFATWNPLMHMAVYTPSYSEGNLRAEYGSYLSGVWSTMAGHANDKWYWELYIENSGSAGAVGWGSGFSNNSGLNAENYRLTSKQDSLWGVGGEGYDYSGITWTNGDVLGFAIDTTAGTSTMYKNGTQVKSDTRSSWQNIPCFPKFHWDSDGSFAFRVIANFGQDSSFAGRKTSGSSNGTDTNGLGDFYYNPPSGYKAICAANIEVATAVDPFAGNSPQDHFNTVLWTGNGSYPRTITGVGFQPDLVWSKARSTGGDHLLYDVLRGTGTTKCLSSSTNQVEGYYAAYSNLTAFATDGFTVGTTSSGNAWNNSGTNYASWNWKANGSGVSNTDGSVTSTVSANTGAGFSIVTYTGTGSNLTVGHGLNEAPDMVIIKGRDYSDFWWVGHNDIGSGWTGTDYIALSGIYSYGWDGNRNTWTGAPTSTVVRIGTDNIINNNGNDYIMYAFHSVDGFSKFGKYIGNSSGNGTFVYTGFRPAFVITKRIDNGSSWFMFDNDRNGYNETEPYVLANASNVEATDLGWDLLSNGFKLRHNYADTNASGGTYIYMAFAENPFKYANAR